MTCGVYIITSPSGKCYVGSSNCMPLRWKTHSGRLRRGVHHSRALQNAWNKYGEQLIFVPLLICTPNIRLWYEQRAIDILRPKYNGLTTAVCGAKPGRIVSLETRAKISAANKGKKPSALAIARRKEVPFTAEHREKLAMSKRGKVGPRLGQTLSIEARAAISAKLKGRKRNVESCAKQSATLLKSHWRDRQ